MSAQQSSTQTREGSHASGTRLDRRWLLLARGVWITQVVLTLAIFFASLPAYIVLLRTPCSGSACSYLQLTPEQAVTLKGMGLFPGMFIVYTVALTCVLMVVCLVVSMVIVWRRTDDRMAFIVALFLVTLSPFNVMFNVSASPSPWQVPNECLSFLFITLLPLILAVFPNGHFAPRWMRWPVFAFLSIQIPFTFFQPLASLSISALSVGFVVSIGMNAILVVVQWYRYRRVSSPLERQQTKWVVFGFAVFITSELLGIVLYLLFPGAAAPGSLYIPAFSATAGILILSIPLSFGFAMLRSRLWEIDVIINRALVYGAFTLLLALIYVGLIIGLQALFRGFIGQNNSVAIVLSTLAIVALFQPLRDGIQRIIDRRFYRSKYDAAKTLAAFSATLRNEVDLEQLSEQLLTVVQETMQPAHLSLWISQSDKMSMPSLQISTPPPATAGGDEKTTGHNT
ncbi:MAG TPA: hypothetical protein VF043_25040 [Ktedonobacteraceae bacterium]